MSSEIPQTCKSKVGLLFLRDCNEPATGQCVTCGRAVCAKHQLAGDQGPVCRECARYDEKMADRRETRRWRRRHHYYDHYGYYPYYYGHHRYYSDRDYRSVDREAAVVHEAPDGKTADDAPDAGGAGDFDATES
ncbi:MAG: hypothetical protein JXR37_11625 [Kiritimatiellae bacterium]|nr:hypothetical protein [Kiritimatiellia bacterium]